MATFFSGWNAFSLYMLWNLLFLPYGFIMEAVGVRLPARLYGLEVSGFRLGADFLCLLVQKPGYWGCHPDYGLVFGTSLQQKCGYSFQLLKGILADRIQPYIANSLLKPTA